MKNVLLGERVFGWPTRFPTSRNVGRGSLQVFQKVIAMYFPIGGKGWADPMCGRDARCEFRNDIRSSGTAGIDHQDGLEWLRSLKSASMLGVIYDPPYNDNQGLKYTKLHHTKGDLVYWYGIRREISRILKPGGSVIMFAWNSNSFPSCEIKNIFVVAHGSERNDTIISIHTKK